MVKEKSLYVGISGCPPSKRRGKVVGAVYSSLPQDKEVCEFIDFVSTEIPKEKFNDFLINQSAICESWFNETRGSKRSLLDIFKKKNNGRHFRCKILDGQEYDPERFDDFFVSSELVETYMGRKDIFAANLKYFIYGNIKNETSNFLRKNLIGFRGIKEITVSNFVPIQGKISCPSLTYYAKVLSFLIKNPSSCFLDKANYLI